MVYTNIIVLGVYCVKIEKLNLQREIGDFVNVE